MDDRLTLVGGTTTGPRTTTRQVPATYVTVAFRDGLERTWTIYDRENTDAEQADDLKASDVVLLFRLKARPKCPNLGRPLAETITLFKINMLYYSTIEAIQDIDFID